ncbi:MAG: hypothetical protein K1000chlam3_00462 [Chlamydiae bacterium]|nr:hypothetical protein [Chlamydiota bacterium]
MNRTFRILSLFCLGLYPHTSHALIIKTIDELHPLKVTLSKQSLNRIGIENSGVRKVIAPEGLFDIQIDDVTKQVFLTIIEAPEQPVAISIITDNGYIQDLEVSALDKPTEVVLLKEPTQEEETEQLFPRKLIAKVISSVAKNTLPYGYIYSKINSKDSRKLRNQSLQMQTIQVLEGPYERVVTYKMKNISTVKTPLKESYLSNPNDLWIYLEKDILEPNEETILIIARDRS